ncbi:PREDICTED: uncharacterized protein LOC109179758 [Ipomoea nil]|uniref:uncharacterized protein LOC109179758 n=1 Tax=Ipomoea nil TaxID=35883 RepID=UPI000900F390|nr:PREDICTED: uncharacterized protein LOC109179758 [Ipomoea nil]
MYGKIYLRGKYYEFNPDIINNHINTTEGEERILLANDEVNQELTAGNVNLEKNKIKAASLTSKYAVLQKIALENWMPSLHESTLKRSLADLLYKIGKGIKVDLSNLIYTQVTNLAENKGTKACLIFPNLICFVLAKQGLKIHKPKSQVKILSTTIKLTKGRHQNDLKTLGPKDKPTDQQTLINYFEKRLSELEASEKHVLRKQMEIKEEKTEEPEAESSERNEVEDDQEPEAESSEDST